jgi:hypothetical protein
MNNGKLNNGKIETLTPLWDKGYSSKAGTNEFIELPIITSRKEIPLYNFINSKVTDIINIQRFNAAFQRLLIYKTKTGTFRQVVLTYLPDFNYIEGKGIEAE